MWTSNDETFERKMWNTKQQQQQQRAVNKVRDQLWFSLTKLSSSDDSELVQRDSEQV